nr:MAG TPA: hypothetical protein [Caudoviricetes sp.]
MRPPAGQRLRRILAISPRCARSYPRHACPLYVVVFMHLHDLRKSPPVLAGLSKNDPQTIMRSHAA